MVLPVKKSDGKSNTQVYLLQMDSIQMDFDRVKSEIFKLAEMKYDCCTYNDSPQKTDEIKVLLEKQKQLNTLDIGLFTACVSRIWISHFCTVEVELINGMRIKNITERPAIKSQARKVKFTINLQGSSEKSNIIRLKQ